MHWICQRTRLQFTDSNWFWQELLKNSGLLFHRHTLWYIIKHRLLENPRFSLMIFPFNLIYSRCSMAMFDYQRVQKQRPGLSSTSLCRCLGVSVADGETSEGPNRQSLSWLRRRFDVWSMWQVNPIDCFFQVNWLKKWDHMRTDKIR